MATAHMLDKGTLSALRRVIDDEGSTARAAGRLRIGRHTIERALARLPVHMTTATAIRLAVREAGR